MPADDAKLPVTDPVRLSEMPRGSLRKRRILGSLAAAFVGWLTMLGFGLVTAVVGGPDSLIFVMFASVIYAVVILAVWLVVLWPLYTFVPRGSILWRWPVCTACGLVGGTLIAFLILAGGNPSALPRLLSLDTLIGCVMLGGVVGAATCLFGSLTAPYFLGPNPADPSGPDNVPSTYTPPFHASPLGGPTRFPRLWQTASRLKQKLLQIAGQ